jgi:hypothetical protein
MIRSIKAKFIRVSLAEWDLLSISINEYTAMARPAASISQPAIEAGTKKIPVLLNHGKFILTRIKVNKLIISELRQ